MGKDTAVGWEDDLHIEYCLTAVLSKGLPMPESSIAFSGTAIYQSAEDSIEDMIKPRLLSAGADCTRIAFIDDAECGLTVNGARIESAIIETGARLLVLDPLQAYLGESYEMNCADGIRPMMKQLTAVANRTGCAIVIIGHMNKASSAKGIYRGLGSIDITAAARSVRIDIHLTNVVEHVKIEEVYVTFFQLTLKHFFHSLKGGRS